MKYFLTTLCGIVLLASCRTTPSQPAQLPQPDVLTVPQAVAAANHAVRTLRLPAETKQAARAFPWAAKITEADIREPETGMVFVAGWSPFWHMEPAKAQIWFIRLTQPGPGPTDQGCEVMVRVTLEVQTKTELLAFLRGRGPHSARIVNAAVTRPDSDWEMDYFYGHGHHQRISMGSVPPSESDPPQKVRPLSERPF